MDDRFAEFQFFVKALECCKIYHQSWQREIWLKAIKLSLYISQIYYALFLLLFFIQTTYLLTGSY